MLPVKAAVYHEAHQREAADSDRVRRDSTSAFVYFSPRISQGFPITLAFGQPQNAERRTESDPVIFNESLLHFLSAEYEARLRLFGRTLHAR